MKKQKFSLKRESICSYYLSYEHIQGLREKKRRTLNFNELNSENIKFKNFKFKKRKEYLYIIFTYIKKQQFENEN